MVYCEQCGAANDIMNQQCHRCGFQFVPIEPLPGERVHAVVAPVAALSTDRIPDMESAAGIGAGLELPEWLQKAAAVTPEIPAAARPAVPDVPVFPGTPHAPAPTWPQPTPQSAPEFPLAPAGIADLATPVRPEPTRPLTPPAYQAHSTTMPEWLKTGQPPILRPAQPDSSDTSSFISEGDLPEWIRQIGAADTAKRLEDERIAAELSRATEEPSAGKTLLPGEDNVNGAASNPWLSRKEGSLANSAWAGSAMPVQPRPKELGPQSDDNERPEVIQVNPDVAPAESKSKSKRAMPSMPSMKMPGLPKPSLPKIASTSDSVGAGNPMMRYALIGAIALLVIVLLILVVL